MPWRHRTLAGGPVTALLLGLSLQPSAAGQQPDRMPLPVVASIKKSVDNEPGMIIRPTPKGTHSAVKVVAAATAVAQSPAPAEQRFEVASIKRNTSGAATTQWTPTIGRFVAVNVTLKRLISSGFGAPQQALADFQIAGGPAWLDSEHFDLAATAPGATPAQMIPMLRRLLEERFQLRTRSEDRQLPVYSLVRARKDGALGSGMRPNTADCDALVNGPPAERCGGGQIFPGTLLARGVSMTQIVNGLARLMPGVSRFVLDRTGLTGRYDIELKWTPTVVEFPQLNDPAATAQMPPIDPNGPSLFTALQEQWGLRLEAGTGPVPVLVIESATMPTED